MPRDGGAPATSVSRMTPSATVARPLARQDLAECTRRIGEERRVIAAHHREAHRPIERRHIARLQSARLALAEPQPGHGADAGFDLVVDRNGVSQDPHGVGKREESVALPGIDHFHRLEAHPSLQELPPAPDPGQLGPRPFPASIG